MARSVKTFLVALSCTAGSALGHDHDQINDQPEALAMFAFLMLSVLMSTMAISYQQKRHHKATPAVSTANEDLPKTS